MVPSLKYQPYRGYGCAHPFLWYNSPLPPKRVRTRSDWRYPYVRTAPWKRYAKDSNAARYEKARVHRAFRRVARLAIARELAGDDSVSHAFRAYGDWLD